MIDGQGAAGSPGRREDGSERGAPLVESLTGPRAGGVVRTLAPEDVRPGMLVTVLRVRKERTTHSFFTGETAHLEWTCIPRSSGKVRRVEEVCLPFVLAATLSARPELRRFDVRRHALAEVGEAYAEALRREEARRRARDPDTESD